MCVQKIDEWEISSVKKCVMVDQMFNSDTNVSLRVRCNLIINDVGHSLLLFRKGDVM